MKTSEDSSLFNHMNQKNMTQAELDQARRKKRKLNQVSGNENIETINIKQTNEFKEPEKKVVNPVSNIKECPFNPFGDDSCDMCGS